MVFPYGLADLRQLIRVSSELSDAPVVEAHITRLSRADLRGLTDLRTPELSL